MSHKQMDRSSTLPTSSVQNQVSVNAEQTEQTQPTITGVGGDGQVTPPDFLMDAAGTMTQPVEGYEEFDVKLLPNIPDELKAGLRWVCWAAREREGKLTKVPINPSTGLDAKTDDPTTWGTINQAVSHYLNCTDDVHGIGRVMSAGDGYIGIDFDNCLDEGGQLVPDSDAARWVPKFNSYTEISPSGKGVKIWIKAQHDMGGKTGRRDAKKGIEVYRDRRYFTVTGRRLPGTSDKVEDRQAVLDDFYREHFGRNETDGPPQDTPTYACTLEDEQIFASATKGFGGERFKQLWDGKWETLYGSQSEADAALCQVLWFHTGDRDRVRQLFGKSALGQRDKWRNRPDYQKSTLDLACQGNVSNTVRAGFTRSDTSDEKFGPSAQLTLPNGSPDGSQNGNTDTSDEKIKPCAWFKAKYPGLAKIQGEPVLEISTDHGIEVGSICQDFMAATLGRDGRPEAPSVYLPHEDKFYRYNVDEGIYTPVDAEDLAEVISKDFLLCARDCRGNCIVTKLEFSLRNHGQINGTMQRAKAILKVDNDFFEKKATGEFIAVGNGMLRVKDRVLLPFSPTYQRRNKVAIPYDPEARCPLFLKTLLEPALPPEDIDLLQRWAGQALLGINLAQTLLLLIGTAGGGKGTFIRVICGIIGSRNMASLRTHLLGERFELSRYAGRTLLYGADVSSDFLNCSSASVLKSLTGGDPITQEFKNSNEAPDVVCRYNVVVTANSQLTVHLEGDTDAWRRRLIIISFEKPKPEKIIADLSEKIIAQEGSGVLNWMLDGLDKLEKDRWQLVQRSDQQERVDDLLLESDGHRVFVKQCIVKDASATVTITQAYERYVSFCDEKGWAPIPRIKFGKMIENVVIQEHRVFSRNDIMDDTSKKAQRGWKGITLVKNLQ